MCEKLSKMAEIFEKQNHRATKDVQVLKRQLRRGTVVISVVVSSVVLLRGWV